jgi:hypothetical protein
MTSISELLEGSLTIRQIYDFMSSQLVHNKTFAYRLPPSFIHHARDLVNFNEDLIFSDKAMGGIGNGRFLSLLFFANLNEEIFSCGTNYVAHDSYCS